MHQRCVKAHQLLLVYAGMHASEVSSAAVGPYALRGEVQALVPGLQALHEFAEAHLLLLALPEAPFVLPPLHIHGCAALHLAARKHGQLSPIA
jgi:hypothetical protein